MADRIKVSTEVLKKWAQDLKAIQTDFNESASILRDVNAVGDLVLLLYSERTVMENGCYAAEVYAVYPNTNRLSPLAN